jgi:ribosomal 50S subunit-recycling heat shock protein
MFRMRIDLFLKVSGLLKTRSIAGKAIGSGAVSIDGELVKPSTQVESGALIDLIKPDGDRVLVRVLKVPETSSVSKKDRSALIEMIERREPDCL